MTKTLAMTLTMSLAVAAQAQTMSLQECIDFALEHNNSIRQKELQRQNSEIELNSSKNTILPSVSGSISQGWSFGRTTSEDSNSYSSSNSTSTSFGLNAEMPLFTGFRVSNQIKSNDFALKATTANLEKARKDIGIQVASYYLNALYYKGLTDVQRRQVALDSVALINARTLFDAGKRPESEVATAEAQLAVSQHSLTEAIGNETMARLDLMQALNMEGNVVSFAIMDVDTSNLSSEVSSAEDIFAQAIEQYPSILAAKYSLESSKYDLKASRSGYIPSISLHAGYNTSYQYLYNFPSTVSLPDGSQVPVSQKGFGRQLTDHAYKSIGINVSIPIFDRFSTRNTMRRARLNIESQSIALTEAQQSLHKEIQQAYWNALKARDNFASAQKATAATTLAYQYEADRYQSGKGTSYDLQQASNKHQKSLQDELQSKYEFLMRLKILEFYNAN